MPTCPYHGNPTPCHCGYGQPRPAPNVKPCPYHGNPNCACGYGQPRPAPYIPPHLRYVPPHLRPRPAHTHGFARPCKIRCGVNEGLCILNTQASVVELYTDSLIGCTQIIFRNAIATFTCHVSSDAPYRVLWTEHALRAFERKYGRVVKCYVVAGDSPEREIIIIECLEKSIHDVECVGRVHGYTINIASGLARETPRGWNTSQRDVAGWQTAQGLIDLRLTHDTYLGADAYGDYHETCPACEERFR